MFEIRIISPQGVLFEGQCNKAFFQGDTGEFEILDYHKPIVSILRQGNILIDEEKSFPVNKGIMRFSNQECVVLTQE